MTQGRSSIEDHRTVPIPGSPDAASTYHDAGERPGHTYRSRRRYRLSRQTRAALPVGAIAAGVVLALVLLVGLRGAR